MRSARSGFNKQTESEVVEKTRKLGGVPFLGLVQDGGIELAMARSIAAICHLEYDTQTGREKVEEIAIIGARSLGQIAAADLTLRGFRVNLYEEPKNQELLEPLVLQGGIDLLFERYYTVHTKPTLAFDRIGFAKPNKVTTDIAEAVSDAGIIVVAVHAYRHEDIAELLAPHLKEGQTIVISAGNIGSLIFAKTFREKNVRVKFLLAETCPSLYGGRFGPEYGLGEGQCATPNVVFIDPEDRRARTTLVSAFPAVDTQAVVERLRRIFKVESGSNVLEVALSNENLFTHVPMCILSTSWIEKSEGHFRLHLQALTPSVERVRASMRHERDAIFRLMGWSARRLTHMDASGSRIPSPITLHIGPTSLDKHRFIAEDAQIGDTFLTSFGDMVGVPTPTTKALVHMASVINQTDYFKTGRTVEKAGIAGLGINQVNQFLREGHLG